jgi:hypothetical protein
MTDLDSTQVALVNGDISKFDKQAQDDMYAAGLAYLKENNPSTYDQALSGHYDDGDGVLQQYGYTSNLKKTVTITIDQNTTDAYYLVSVDVNYTSALADKDSNGNVTSIIDTISLEYNVFSQKFYYDKEKTTPSVPSVYIEYQPFTFDGVDYAASEYIFVENYVDGAKVYLYQPAKDLSYAKNNGGTVDPDEVASSTGSYKQNSLSNSDKVNIQINTLVKSDADKTTQGKTTYIYTNLVETSEVDGTIVRSIDMSNQFNLSKINANDSIYGATEYAAFDNINTDAAYDPSKTTLFLKDVQDDKTTTDRLYTATVIVSPRTENANTVTLTGAKGGQ